MNSRSANSHIFVPGRAVYVLAAVLGAVLVAGCGDDDAGAEPVAEGAEKAANETPAEAGAAQEIGADARVVEALPVTLTRGARTLRMEGELAPRESATLTAEVGGRVAEVSFREGDRVAAGELAVRLAEQETDADARLLASRAEYANAQATLNITREAGEESVRTAQVAFETAAKKYRGQGDGSASLTEADAAIDNAEVDLLDAQEALEEERDALAEQERALGVSQVNLIADVRITAEVAAADLNELLGLTITADADLGGFLGNRMPQTRIDAENALRRTMAAIDELPDESASLEQVEELLLLSRELLRESERMLANSFVSGDATAEAALSTWRSTVSGYRSSVEGGIEGIEAMRSQLEDFEINAPKRLRSAQAAVDRATVGLEKANASRSGTEETLAESLLAAEASLELAVKNAENSVAASRAARDRAAADVRTASRTAEKNRILVPFSGIFTERLIDVGDTVGPGSPLFSVADTGWLVLRGTVSAQDFSALSVGLPAQIDTKYFGTRSGFINRINPVAQPETRRFSVEVAVENIAQPQLPANVFAHADIQLPRSAPVVAVPRGALVPGEENAVFVITPDEAESGLFVANLREVQLESATGNGETLFITSGLAKGELIIARVPPALKNGDRVRLSAPEQGEDA